MQQSETQETTVLRAHGARFHGLLLADCPFCENLHLHEPKDRESDGLFACRCEPASLSPLAGRGYALSIEGEVGAAGSVLARPVPFGEPRLWRHLREAGGTMRAAAMGVLLQRKRSVASARLILGGVALEVEGARWWHGDKSGEGLPTLAAAIYRTDAETAAARLAEAALGLRLDAEAFSGLRSTFAGYFARNPAPWHGRTVSA